MSGWHMRGVFIAEPSVAAFGRQLLNTVVEQVLKKALLPLPRNSQKPRKGSQLCLVDGLQPDAGWVTSQRLFKEVGMGCDWRTM